MPPAARIEATGQLFGLNGSQRRQLPDLLERWLGSPEARAMQGHAHVVPEQPFWVRLRDGDEAAGRAPLVLQGFIDLLAYDELGCGRASVIDYKTGTHLQGDAERRAAYGLQAACYAYALLLQGFDEVVLDFVFVDQPDPADPGRPSTTRFPSPGEEPYDRASLDRLRQLILQHL